MTECKYTLNNKDENDTLSDVCCDGDHYKTCENKSCVALGFDLPENAEAVTCKNCGSDVTSDFTCNDGYKKSDDGKSCVSTEESCKYPYTRLSQTYGTCTISDSVSLCINDSCCKTASQSMDELSFSAPTPSNKISSSSASCTDSQGVVRYETLCSGTTAKCSGRKQLSTCTSSAYTIAGTKIPVNGATFYECGDCDTDQGYYDTESACKIGIGDGETCASASNGCYQRKSLCSSGKMVESQCTAQGGVLTSTGTENGVTCGTCSTCESSETLYKAGTEAPETMTCHIINSTSAGGVAYNRCCSSCGSGSYGTKSACESHAEDGQVCVSSGGCYKPTTLTLSYQSGRQYASSGSACNVISNTSATNTNTQNYSVYKAYNVNITMPDGTKYDVSGLSSKTLTAQLGTYTICATNTSYDYYGNYVGGSSNSVCRRNGIKYFYIRVTGAGTQQQYLCPSDSTNSNCTGYFSNNCASFTLTYLTGSGWTLSMEF